MVFFAHLTDEQRFALDEAQGAYDAAAGDHLLHGAAFALRFLEVAKWDLGKAKKALLAAAKVRKEFGLDELRARFASGSTLDQDEDGAWQLSVCPMAWYGEACSGNTIGATTFCGIDPWSFMSESKERCVRGNMVVWEHSITSWTENPRSSASS
jgi:hypothetical protein